MITHYTKQNKLQKEVMRIKSIFITDWNKVNKARDYGYEGYNFGPSRRERVAVGMIIFSALVPCTFAGITIPLIYKTMLGGRK